MDVDVVVVDDDVELELEVDVELDVVELDVVELDVDVVLELLEVVEVVHVTVDVGQTLETVSSSKLNSTTLSWPPEVVVTSSRATIWCPTIAVQVLQVLG